MPPELLTILTIIFGSTGMWALLSQQLQKMDKKKDSQSQMLIGLAHDRICDLCQAYINRGWITKDEYENLFDYLFIPYKLLGGNGTAEKMINDVSKLPMKIEEVKK